MSDKALVKEIINQILTAIARIERRSSEIANANDFVTSDAGIDMLDSIGMMLIAIGESCKNLDKITSGELLARYPAVDWKGAKGMRDVISHHYFDINAEIVLSVCRKQIPLLRTTFETILRELD
jgi:uncharacterized protein with HEPN domain